MFCCYTLLLDVVPLSPNQFETHPWDAFEADLYFQNRMASIMFSVRVYPFLYPILVYSCKAVTDP